MTREEEAKLRILTNKKKHEIEREEYYGELQYYFRNLLWYMELDKDTLSWNVKWLDSCSCHLIIMALEAKFDVDGKETESIINCCLFERDGFYRVYRHQCIYVDYCDKIYEIDLESGDYEIGTGDYVGWFNVTEFDKNVFGCSPGLIEAYHDNCHPNQKELSKIPDKSYQIRLNHNTNVISEVLTRIKRENKARTNKK